MIVECNMVKKSVVIDAGKLKSGQIGRLVEHFSNETPKGSYLLGTYSGPVSLSDPTVNWDTRCTLQVEVMPIGFSLTITTEL